ncbi:hypothetical protein BDR26DRAFT_873830 [Obelidium mucronatum]|nr:hypothetical protein BDR26DRAFT_873830 [Obelidium mucronatum]
MYSTASSVSAVEKPKKLYVASTETLAVLKHGSQLPSPLTPGNKTLFLKNSDETLATQSSTSCVSLNSQIPKKKYRSSFSTRKNMHQARQQQQQKNRDTNLLSMHMVNSKGNLVGKKEWTEKVQIKSELNKRLKARLLMKDEIYQEGDRIAHIDSERGDANQEEAGSDYCHTIDQPLESICRNPSELSNIPPTIREQPPTPPFHGLPLSYRENYDWNTHSYQHYQPNPHVASQNAFTVHHSYGTPSHHQFYYAPPPQHTVVVYHPSPFLDPVFHHQLYPPHEPISIVEQAIYLPSLQPFSSKGTCQYPISSTSGGSLSSTLVRSPQLSPSPAVWLNGANYHSGPHNGDSYKSPENSNSMVSSLKANDTVKIISRSSSAISIGALIDPPGTENAIFGLQAL